ncbi:MAG TPA: VOC family protein [Frateuria sp.]|uniref:VOC family protein n=1 Tax=Frateuria sp. TaxID=2211372 RepID=UPI002D7FE44C|nr:VOC family protein [Frateuria sp.]HET6804785.1 VOC family protein [Frateuria sp.]
MQVQPYLFFEGRCEEAVTFYRDALGAQVHALLRYSDAPQGGDAGCPGGTPPPADKVMHASLQIGQTLVMASDGFAAGHPEFKGISLSLAADDDAQARKMFDALAAGGQVQQPLGPSFFASSFGMLTDRFGVSWMVVAGAKG